MFILGSVRPAVRVLTHATYTGRVTLKKQRVKLAKMFKLHQSSRKLSSSAAALTPLSCATCDPTVRNPTSPLIYNRSHLNMNTSNNMISEATSHINPLVIFSPPLLLPSFSDGNTERSGPEVEPYTQPWMARDLPLINRRLGRRFCAPYKAY
ncbi:hypothetical protein G7K_1151-t1 [Saitoella complicata NRRL Y-17804]|uniref:Uncharacterized protein n=1 Tax=Saitoella complicata (strain BCRC 22490 / CBS 7301 / JCM 7358 / NBRC 10748 / NRRL Y-17804) TaxID=698492 RepID=A0A0E9NAW2_SAICN|nr:hypothetical protein G7K_1151-t1 [Saitoella complicata NRRL Y-17804]